MSILPSKRFESMFMKKHLHLRNEKGANNMQEYLKKMFTPFSQRHTYRVLCYQSVHEIIMEKYLITISIDANDEETAPDDNDNHNND
jgi:hypothetical protein